MSMPAAPLAELLEMAVPLAMLDLHRAGGPSEADYEWCRTVAADDLAEHGDGLLYRGAKKGDSGRIAGVLIKATAIAAFVPGGIHLFGCHFDAGAADASGARCCVSPAWVGVWLEKEYTTGKET